MLQGGYISCHSLLIGLGLGKANSQDDGLAIKYYTEMIAFKALRACSKVLVLGLFLVQLVSTVFG